MQKAASVFALAALGLIARPAAGQTVEFDMLCTTGAFQVCTSVHVTLVNGTTLRMRVWNLQGLIGQGSTLTAVGLFHPTPQAQFTGTATLSTVKYVTSGGEMFVTGDWQSPASDISTLGGVFAELTTGSETGHKGGIVGCTDPGPTSANHRMTCLSWPDIPYVEFTFDLSGDQWDMDNLAVRFHAQQLGDDGEESIKCDTTLPEGNEYHCSVVPEPVTLALVGSGLAGVVGVGWLRRRRSKTFDIQNG